jgi:flagellar motor switch protein FliN
MLSFMRADHDAVLKLEVPVIVEIGRTNMRTAQVMKLCPGHIIELPKSPEDELEMLVNNKTIGTGIAVKIGENFGLQISYIGDVRQRLEALASGEATAGEPGRNSES